VKKPVAVPTKWKVPSGALWVTSKVQVTKSPCGLLLERAAVSDMASPSVGVNSKVTLNDWTTKTDVLPATWPGVKSPLPLRTNWTGCPATGQRGIVQSS
jgi:hypothetical protein